MSNETEYDLKIILLAAREKKGISQRKLAKQIGVHHSSLNDIENGKIKKIDIEILRKLAEELDLSLELLLKAAGYDEFLLRLKGDSLDNKSTRDLKNLIKDYRKSELDLLDFDYQKRRTTRNARQKMFVAIEQMKIMKDHEESLYTIDKAIEDMQSIFKQLEMVEEKYDYNKLPKDYH